MPKIKHCLVTHLGITSLIALSTQALVLSSDKLLSTNRLFAFITYKTFLMEGFALIANFLLPWSKISTTYFTNFGGGNSTTGMADQVVFLEGEPLI